VSRATGDGSLRRARLLALFIASVGLLSPSNAVSAPRGAARPRVQAAPAPKGPSLTQRFARQLLELARTTPIDAAAAARILGSAPTLHSGQGRSRETWELAPTDLVAKAVVSRLGRNGHFIIEIEPAPALNFAFQDAVEPLQDFLFWVDKVAPHWGDDSVATRISQIRYRFRVPAGELLLESETPIPPEADDQQKLAMTDARDIAAGNSPRRALIQSILITNQVTSTWSFFKSTLRQYRKRLQKDTQKANHPDSSIGSNDRSTSSPTTTD
jgi:hypothetical protein